MIFRSLVLAMVACLFACSDSGGGGGGKALSLDLSLLIAEDFGDGQLRAVLHSADGLAVEQDIDLVASGGVAEFGPVGGKSATVSLVEIDAAGNFEITTFSGLPSGEYRVTGAASPCAETVAVDLTVDTSATADGSSDGAIATGFAGVVAAQAASEAATSWEFPGLPSCAGADGRFFAQATVAGRPDLWVLEAAPDLEDGAAHTVQTTQPVSEIPVGEMDPPLLTIGLELLIDGLPTGAGDVLASPAAGDPLLAASEAEGAEVVLHGGRMSAGGTAALGRIEAPAAPPAEALLTLWETELELGEFDAERSAQAYSHTAADTAQLVELGYAFESGGEEPTAGTWKILADAGVGEVLAPVLPEDVEALFERAELPNSVTGLQLSAFDGAGRFSDLMRLLLSDPQVLELSGRDTASAVLQGSGEPPPDEGGDDGFCIPVIEFCPPI